MEDAESLEVMIKTGRKVMRAVVTKGSRIIDDKLISGEECGEYMKFTVGTVPILGTVLLTP